MATLEVTLEQLSSRLSEQARVLANPSFRAAWPAVALYLSSRAKQSFASGVSPDGLSWAPLKRTSKRRGGPGAKPLRNTGMLMASIQQGSAGHVEKNTDTLFTFGTNISYAGYHQWGTRHIPARPFLGLTPKDVGWIADIVADVAVKELMR